MLVFASKHKAKIHNGLNPQREMKKTEIMTMPGLFSYPVEEFISLDKLAEIISTLYNIRG